MTEKMELIGALVGGLVSVAMVIVAVTIYFKIYKDIHSKSDPIDLADKDEAKSIISRKLSTIIVPAVLLVGIGSIKYFLKSTGPTMNFINGFSTGFAWNFSSMSGTIQTSGLSQIIGWLAIVTGLLTTAIGVIIGLGMIRLIVERAKIWKTHNESKTDKETKKAELKSWRAMKFPDMGLDIILLEGFLIIIGTMLAASGGTSIGHGVAKMIPFIQLLDIMISGIMYATDPSGGGTAFFNAFGADPKLLGVSTK